MVQEDIRGGICHAIHQYPKDNNKHMKDYDKKWESWYLSYWHASNLYGWAMPQKLLVDIFMCVENTCQFSKDFLENYNEDTDEGCFLKLMFSILINYMSFTMI